MEATKATKSNHNARSKIQAGDTVSCGSGVSVFALSISGLVHEAVFLMFGFVSMVHSDFTAPARLQMKRGESIYSTPAVFIASAPQEVKQPLAHKESEAPPTLPELPVVKTPEAPEITAETPELPPPQPIEYEPAITQQSVHTKQPQQTVSAAPASAKDSGVTRGAEPIQDILPEYPPASVRSGEEGVVLLCVEVLASGQPARIKLLQSSSYDRLDRAAMAAVRRTRFLPAMEQGKPVDTWVTIPFRFRLK